MLMLLVLFLLLLALPFRASLAASAAASL